MTQRSYAEAISLLNQIRHHRATVSKDGVYGRLWPVNEDSDRTSRPHRNPQLRGRPGIENMKEYLMMMGYTGQELKTIHIAGTKGKGSTCAFTSSILRSNFLRTGHPHSIGVYTKPALTTIRDNIQINRQSISEELFAKYCFEVWEAISTRSSHVSHHDIDDAREPLQFSDQDPHPFLHSPVNEKTGKTASRDIQRSHGPETDLAKEEIKRDGQRYPGILQFMFLVAFHAFVCERVSVAIFEAHCGGEYCATNVLPSVVAGITAVGMDHRRLLGPSIENVAWNKGGIFKTGRRAFASQQEERIAAVLRDRAREKRVDLTFVDEDDERLPTDHRALKSRVQAKNACLAVQLSEGYLESIGGEKLTRADIEKGVEEFKWPGRFETILQGENSWFLDGAHNAMSMTVAGEWFGQMVADAPRDALPTILIFNHYSVRDGEAMLEELITTLAANHVHLDNTILTTNIESGPDCENLQYENLMASSEHRIDICKTLFPESKVWVEPTVQGSLNKAKEIGLLCGGMRTLITGSLSLIRVALPALNGHVSRYELI